MARDYYETLGVDRSADDATIKKAFRKLARELHPDVNAHDPDAEEKFKEAAAAYEVLNDPERRRLYDSYGEDGLRGRGYAPDMDAFGSVSDLFSAFFGSGSGFDVFGGGGGGRRGRRRRDAGRRRGRDRVDRPRRVGARQDGRDRLRGGGDVPALQRQRRRAGHADRRVRDVRRHRPAPARGADGVRPAGADRGVRGVRRGRPHPGDAMLGVRRRGHGGRAAPRRGRHPGRDRRRAAHPARRGGATRGSTAGPRATSTWSFGWRTTSASCATPRTS